MSSSTLTRVLTALAPFCVLLVLGCAESSQTRVQVPLEVQGTASAGPRMALGAVPVTLTRADLAFGPLYLCAGAQAGELCETARLEWLDTVVVDALDPTAQEAGTLYGVSGVVQSWMFDLGISAQLTRDEPFVLDAAEALDGASLVLEGSAEVSGITVPFVARVPVQQTDATELGVPVVRKSSSDVFREDVDGAERALQVRFDPAAWLAGVDLRSLVTFETCAPDETALRCDGVVEWTCDAGTNTSRDCGALGQVCAPGAGCVDQVELAPGSEPFRALRNALVAGQRPTFTFIEND
ncbi:MAG: hypothetical protein R3B40_22595 [Polyangiales bacterium]|nr:hypothetical protein [Myxococcales bacterium]MCB9656097.1 hypothetical protein [Sandaracinaceae bacterium]